GQEAQSPPSASQPQPTSQPPLTTQPPATQPTPTPTPTIPPAEPTPEPEPTSEPLEHTFDQPSISPKQDFAIPQPQSPTHSPTAGHLNVEDIIQLVSQLISRIDVKRVKTLERCFEEERPGRWLYLTQKEGIRVSWGRNVGKREDYPLISFAKGVHDTYQDKKVSGENPEKDIKEVNLGFENINSGDKGVNTGSTTVKSGTDPVNTDSIK
ncbi:hypothetical protein Tco_0161037, partial [Tanacetum coccineum]